MLYIRILISDIISFFVLKGKHRHCLDEQCTGFVDNVDKVDD